MDRYACVTSALFVGDLACRHRRAKSYARLSFCFRSAATDKPAATAPASPRSVHRNTKSPSDSLEPVCEVFEVTGRVNFT